MQLSVDTHDFWRLSKWTGDPVDKVYDGGNDIVWHMKAQSNG